MEDGPDSGLGLPANHASHPWSLTNIRDLNQDTPSPRTDVRNKIAATVSFYFGLNTL